MEHRGVQFRVLQSISKGWCWDFEGDDVTRSGTGVDRQDAETRAREAIDASFHELRANEVPDFRLNSSDCRTLATEYKVRARQPSTSSESSSIMNNVARSLVGLATQLDMLTAKLRDEAKSEVMPARARLGRDI